MIDDNHSVNDTDNEDDKSFPERQRLNPVELRVLGCLMEKELTTPDQYPLTENTVKLACNQKTNRHPVMNLSACDVGRSLRHLVEKGWVDADHGTRAVRFSQKTRFKLKISKAQQAALCIILLRGPQTLSELKARTERMLSDENELVDALLASLEHDPALLEILPPQSGQREERYKQCLFPQEMIVGKTTVSNEKDLGEHTLLDEERFQALEESLRLLTERIDRLEAKYQ